MRRFAKQCRSVNNSAINFVAIDSHLYKIFKITRVSFFGHTLYIYVPKLTSRYRLHILAVIFYCPRQTKMSGRVATSTTLHQPLWRQSIDHDGHDEVQPYIPGAEGRRCWIFTCRLTGKWTAAAGCIGCVRTGSFTKVIRSFISFLPTVTNVSDTIREAEAAVRRTSNCVRNTRNNVLWNAYISRTVALRKFWEKQLHWNRTIDCC